MHGACLLRHSSASFISLKTKELKYFELNFCLAFGVEVNILISFAETSTKFGGTGAGTGELILGRTGGENGKI
jgi:hypothetical protein